MTGIKHISKFKVGQRLNGFVLLENIRRDHPKYHEWLWKCQCDCGNIFYSRERKLLTRCGCISCTAAIRQRDFHISKSGIEQLGVKKRIYREYKRGAIKRNLSFELTFDEFLNITSKPCTYCGKEPYINNGNVQYMQTKANPWKHNGIDRLDTTKGYTLDNCVPCCSNCNYAKHDLTLENFKQWISDVYHHLNLERSTTISKESTNKCLEMENS